MIDLKRLREQPELFQRSLDARGSSVSVAEIVQLDERTRQVRTQFEEKKAQQNEVTKQIPTLTGEEKERVLGEMKTLSEEIKTLGQELQDAEKNLQDLVLRVPSLLDETTPVGKDETENLLVRSVGEPTTFSFTPKEHWELGADLDLIDLERGAKVSGSRFYYLKGALVQLNRALQQYVIDKVTKHGFMPITPPFLVREEAMYGTGFFPADRNEIYTVNPGEDELFLIGTSEVPLMSYHSDEILDETELPKRYVGISPCFRREAGSYGKDTKGILRVHQFEKVEMVILATPEQAREEHERILAVEEEIMQGLQLPYRVMGLCSGDIGFASSKTYDIEAWMPGQGQYREVTSTSNCTDFQTRRLKIRYKKENGEKALVYGLNGTGTSMRPLIAIMENYQQADGSIRIPEVLQSYMGGQTEIRN